MSRFAHARWRGRWPLDRRGGGDAADRPPAALLTAIAVAITAAYLLLLTWPMRIWARPVSPHTHLVGTFGVDRMGALRYTVIVAVLFALYGLALWAVLSGRCRPSRRWVLGWAAAFCLALLFTHPLSSTDIFNYMAGARLQWVHGDNPLTTAPRAYPDDPFFGLLAFWQDIPSPYGPLWSLLTYLPYTLGRDQPLATVLAFKALAVVALLLTGALVAAAAERLDPGSGPSAALVLTWNPLVVWHVAGNGHNDAVMALWLALAAYLVTRGARSGKRRAGTEGMGGGVRVAATSDAIEPSPGGRPFDPASDPDRRRGAAHGREERRSRGRTRAHHPAGLPPTGVGAGHAPITPWASPRRESGPDTRPSPVFMGLALLALTASALVKFATVLVAPAVLVWWWRRERRLPWRAAPWLGAAAALAVALYAPYWQGRQTFATALDEGSYFTVSGMAVVRGALLSIMDRPTAETAAIWLGRAAFAALYALILVRVRGRDVSALLVSGALALGAYLLMAATYFAPWYLIWPLTLAAIVPGRGRLLAPLLGATLGAMSILLWATWARARLAPDPLADWYPMHLLSFASVVFAAGVAYPAAVWIGRRPGRSTDIEPPVLQGEIARARPQR